MLQPAIMAFGIRVDESVRDLLAGLTDEELEAVKKAETPDDVKLASGVALSRPAVTAFLEAFALHRGELCERARVGLEAYEKTLAQKAREENAAKAAPKTSRRAAQRPANGTAQSVEQPGPPAADVAKRPAPTNGTVPEAPAASTPTPSATKADEAPHGEPHQDG